MTVSVSGYNIADVGGNAQVVVRDEGGDFRYLDLGDFPLPEEVIEYDGDKIAEREREGKKMDLDATITDPFRISDVFIRKQNKLIDSR